MPIRTILALTIGALAVSQCIIADDSFGERNPRYRLHPSDIISVSYRYTPELNATVTIQPDGFAVFPQIGDVKLAELTLAEATGQLKTKASERLNDPDVTIELKEFEKPYYIVGGEVGQPGRFEYRGPVTALRAVEIAGGLKTSSRSNQVLLIRPVNQVDAETKLINLKQVLTAKNLKEDVELRPGDMLIVPKTRLARVEPYIKLVNAGFYLNPLGY